MRLYQTLLDTGLFFDNKFLLEYVQIIENARLLNRKKSQGEYFENHHIIPRSLGGLDKKENLVLLTPTEHRFCHKWLIRITEGENRLKMVSAFWFMFHKNSDDTLLTIEEYAELREEYSRKKSLEMIGDRNPMNKIDFSGENNPNYGRKHPGLNSGEANPMYGRPAPFRGCKHTKETRKFLSELRKGKSSWNKGISMNEEQKQKLRTKYQINFPNGDVHIISGLKKAMEFLQITQHNFYKILRTKNQLEDYIGVSINVID